MRRMPLMSRTRPRDEAELAPRALFVEVPPLEHTTISPITITKSRCNILFEQTFTRVELNKSSTDFSLSQLLRLSPLIGRSFDLKANRKNDFQFRLIFPRPSA